MEKNRKTVRSFNRPGWLVFPAGNQKETNTPFKPMVAINAVCPLLSKFHIFLPFFYPFAPTILVIRGQYEFVAVFVVSEGIHLISIKFRLLRSDVQPNKSGLRDERIRGHALTIIFRSI